MASFEAIRDQALDWAVRTGDPAFEDWDGFTQWLEADPEHAAAYDTVAAAALDGAELIARYGPANDAHAGEPVPEVSTGSPPRRRARPWLAAALASFALLAGFSLWQGQRAQPYTIATRPGEIRKVALGDGTTITLSGATRIQLDHRDRRHARLEDGEALFSVRHDPVAPFEVLTTQDRLVDLGTVFDVRVEGSALAVAVSQGAVQVNPEGVNLHLTPGQQVVRKAGSNELTVSDVALERVGEWRKGRLTFEQASLARVAADLSRATGLTFRAATDAGGAAVTGSVRVDPIREDPARLADLLGVTVTRTSIGWALSAN